MSTKKKSLDEQLDDCRYNFKLTAWGHFEQAKVLARYNAWIGGLGVSLSSFFTSAGVLQALHPAVRTVLISFLQRQPFVTSVVVGMSFAASTFAIYSGWRVASTQHSTAGEAYNKLAYKLELLQMRRTYLKEEDKTTIDQLQEIQNQAFQINAVPVANWAHNLAKEKLQKSLQQQQSQ